MSQYTTGELAKLCEISVRTVQFYDQKDLLHPSELTEGGRRLYSDNDLSKMRLICLLKSFGLSLDSIKGIMESEIPDKVMLLLLDEREKQINDELTEMKQQKEAIDTVRKAIRSGGIISVNSISDIENIMDKQKEREMKKSRMTMLGVGIVLDIAELAMLLLWILKGMWVPFAILMPIVIIICAFIVKSYYNKAVYICPECGETFKPTLKEFFWSRHTRKTRMLTCTACQKKSWCVETFA